MVLDILANACVHFHVANRGHKNSKGVSQGVFYISYGKRGQDDLVLNPLVETFVPASESSVVAKAVVHEEADCHGD